MVKKLDVELSSSHEYIKNTSTSGTITWNIYWMPTEDIILPKTQENSHEAE